jgi:hypothetical protein
MNPLSWTSDSNWNVTCTLLDGRTHRRWNVLRQGTTSAGDRWIVNAPPIQGRSQRSFIVDDLPHTEWDAREMSSERYRLYRDAIRNNTALLYGAPLQHVCEWCGERCGPRPLRVHNKRTCNACLDAMHVGDDDEDVYAPLDIR